MTWKNTIKKDFKSSKEIGELISSAKELHRFLEYRLDRVESGINFYNENEEEYNSVPNAKEYRKSLEKEYNELMRFIPNYVDMLGELVDLEKIIEETVNAENRVD